MATQGQQWSLPKWLVVVVGLGSGAKRGQLLFWRPFSLLCLGLNHSVRRQCSEGAMHRAGCQKNMDYIQGGCKADRKPDQGMAMGPPRIVKHGYILYHLGRSCIC